MKTARIIVYFPAGAEELIITSKKGEEILEEIKIDMKGKVKTCECCGELFASKNKTGKYCVNRCRQIGPREKRKWKHREEY